MSDRGRPQLRRPRRALPPDGGLGSMMGREQGLLLPRILGGAPACGPHPDGRDQTSKLEPHGRRLRVACSTRACDGGRRCERRRHPGPRLRYRFDHGRRRGARDRGLSVPDALRKGEMLGVHRPDPAHGVERHWHVGPCTSGGADRGHAMAVDVQTSCRASRCSALIAATGSASCAAKGRMVVRLPGPDQQPSTWPKRSTLTMRRFIERSASQIRPSTRIAPCVELARGGHRSFWPRSASLTPTASMRGRSLSAQLARQKLHRLAHRKSRRATSRFARRPSIAGRRVDHEPRQHRRAPDPAPLPRKRGAAPSFALHLHHPRHGPSTATFFCKIIAVMYAGRILESGLRLSQFFVDPKDPYIQGLFATAMSSSSAPARGSRRSHVRSCPTFVLIGSLRSWRFEERMSSCLS